MYRRWRNIRERGEINDGRYHDNRLQDNELNQYCGSNYNTIKMCENIHFRGKNMSAAPKNQEASGCCVGREVIEVVTTWNFNGRARAV